jgi:hypothetical protein
MRILDRTSAPPVHGRPSDGRDGGWTRPTSYLLSEPAAADRLGIGFGWLQNAWLLHARLKMLPGKL